MANHTSKTAWLDLLGRLGLSDLNATTHSKLVEAYSGQTRHYHSLAHIEDCLDQLTNCDLPSGRSDPLALAFWFHDAIYNWRSSTNEADSARWAEEFLQGCDAPADLTTQVSGLILATRHFVAEPLEGDQLLMVDIDLSILGREQPVYDRYEAAIRQEYKWVPAITYRRERRKVIRAFLDRETIFETFQYQALYEAPARENLKRALAKL